MEILTSAWLIDGLNIRDIPLKLWGVQGFDTASEVYGLSRSIEKTHDVLCTGHIVNHEQEGDIPYIISLGDLPERIIYAGKEYTFFLKADDVKGYLSSSNAALSNLVSIAIQKGLEPFALRDDSRKFTFPGWQEIIKGKFDLDLGTFYGQHYAQFKTHIQTDGHIVLFTEIKTRWRCRSSFAELENRAHDLKRIIVDENLPFTHQYSGQGFQVSRLIEESPKNCVPPALGRSVFEGIRAFWGDHSQWDHMVHEMENDTFVIHAVPYRPHIPLGIRKLLGSKTFLPSSFCVPMLVPQAIEVYCELFGLDVESTNRKYFNGSKIQPSLYHELANEIEKSIQQIDFALGNSSFRVGPRLKESEMSHLMEQKNIGSLQLREESNKGASNIELRWKQEDRYSSFVEWNKSENRFVNRDEKHFRIGGTPFIGRASGRAFKSPTLDKESIAIIVPMADNKGGSRLVTLFKQKLFPLKWQQFLFGQEITLDPLYLDSLDKNIFDRTLNDVKKDFDGAFVIIPTDTIAGREWRRIYKTFMISQNFAIQGIMQENLKPSIRLEYYVGNLLFQFIAKMGGAVYQTQFAPVNNLKSPLSFGFDLTPFPTGGQIASIVTAYSPDLTQARVYSETSRHQPGIILRDLERLIPDIYSMELSELSRLGVPEPDYVVLVRDGYWFGLDEYGPVAEILDVKNIPYVIASSVSSGIGKIYRYDSSAINPQIGDTVYLDQTSAILVPHHLSSHFQRPLKITLYETNILGYTIKHLRDFILTSALANIAYANPSKTREPLQVVGAHKTADAIKKGLLSVSHHGKNLFYVF